MTDVLVYLTSLYLLIFTIYKEQQENKKNAKRE